MTSEELNDAYSAKLDEVIQFFVREKEAKIQTITFTREYNNSIHTNFLAAIAIVAAIIHFVAISGVTPLVENVGLVLALIVGMLVVTIHMYRNNKQLYNEYKNATHKFDVIINSLQILKILNPNKELSKLFRIMRKKPMETKHGNNSYGVWLDNVYHCAIQLSICD